MKQRTLAPAVLASLTAAGLVLTPVTAFAQDAADTASLTTQSTQDPTEEPTEKPAAPEAAPQDAAKKTGDEGAEEQKSADDQKKASTPEATKPAENPKAPSGAPSDDPTPETGEEREEEDDTPDTADASITVDGAVAVSEVAHVAGQDDPAGLPIGFTGLDPESSYTVEVTGGQEATAPHALSPDADGNSAYSYTFDVAEDADLAEYAGTRTVVVTDADGTEVATGSFEITADTQDDEADDDAQDDDDSSDDGADVQPALDLPSSIRVDDVMVPRGEEPGDRGLAIVATGLESRASYTVTVTAPEENSDLSTSFTITADESGTATGTYFIEWYGDYNADAIACTYTFELLDADDEVLDSADVDFTAAPDDDDDDSDDDGREDDEAPDGGQDDDQDADDQDDDGDDAEESVDPSVVVSPTSLSAATFMNYDRGVQVTALDCAPGESVTLDVFWPGTDEIAYADGIEADDEGTAAFSFYGTGTRASDYVGTWKVSITCGGETVSDSFTVTGPSDDSRGGDELPRTGSEAGVLGIVAASLLTVGAATVMISSRPRRGDRA